MAAAEPSAILRTIRVYCPLHKVGFTASGKAIECSSQKHTLAQDFPNDGFWEYCCDCQHYWPLDAARGSVASEECPACERQIIRRFLCANCEVISVESNSPGRRKAFSISAQSGLPVPACPGCLNHYATDGLDHQCQDFGASFVTPRGDCPFCNEPLVLPPNFPCSVADYLAQLRQPLRVLQFEPKSNVLNESTSGHYILVEKVRGSALPIAIPNVAKLASKQDYYNIYYELFNCDNPASGEVVILSPAIVEKVENGWQLREPGFIEIKGEPLSPSPIAPPQVKIPCAACGDPGEVGHAFCNRCGAPMLGQGANTAASQLAPDLAPDFPDAREDQFTENPTPTSDGAATAIITASTGLPWRGLLGGAAAIALLGVVILISALSGKGLLPGATPSIEKRLDGAIASGNLFGPSTDNAHDLYYQLKNSSASEQTLRNYREKLVPLLSNRPMRMISDLMAPGSEDPPVGEWQAAIPQLRWAAELNLGDSVLTSRAIYCEGRVAYLLKQEDEALAAWTRAADADKTWPLPANGIGLIYFSRKKYDTARSYYFEAARRDPNWAYPYNNLGTAFHYEKNDYAAKEYYRKAIQLAPHWARPHAWLGEIAMKERDFSTAVAEYEAVLDQNSTGTSNMDLNKIRNKLEEARLQMSVSEQ